MAFPPLRNVDAFPVDQDGQRYICLRDPEGYALVDFGEESALRRAQLVSEVAPSLVAARARCVAPRADRTVASGWPKQR